MDGYAASGAALVADGFKQTFACPAPRAIVADLDLIRTAPPSMTASGYADLIGKITAGADWILADALGIDPIQPDIWDMVQPSVRSLLGSAAAVHAHEVRLALEARRQRVLISQSEVTEVKWVTLFIQAICTLTAIAMVHADNRPASAIAMGLFSTAIAVSILLITAHDRPFIGQSGVQPTVLLQVQPDGG